MKKVKGLLIFVCMFLFIAPASAKDINHFYAESDTSVALNDTINASAALAGQTVNASGKVNGILFGAGNDVSLAGEVDYAAVAGNTVKITGTVLKDAAVAGNVVDIKGATFERDLAIGANNVTVSGTFNRNATIMASIAEINDTTVVGNLKLYSNTITIGKNVKIEGQLSYPEDAKVTINDGATIGKIVKTESINKEISLLELFTQKVFSLLSLILIFIVISLVFAKQFKKLDEKYEKFTFEKGIEVFTKGLVILILIPIIAILLMTIVIGMPLAFILIALYVIALYIAKIFAAYLIGTKIAGKWMKKDTSVLIKGLIGLAILFVIGLIPYVSVFAAPIILLIGLGVLFDAFRK